MAPNPAPPDNAPPHAIAPLTDRGEGMPAFLKAKCKATAAMTGASPPRISVMSEFGPVKLRIRFKIKFVNKVIKLIRKTPKAAVKDRPT